MWADIRSPSSFPENALTIGVSAKQFEWNVTYPGADRVLGNEDDFTIRNRFEFPVDEPVIVRLESEDVIHSFFIPEMRVKRHYRMRARVVVHEADAFNRWYDEHTGAAQVAAAD